ncbi:3' terminal RNA ribose 2'-O-methyltransferase Hen1 [Nocardiopsis mangrovi]|uniref:Small RNA 2'-O-methyltransferase n=1 Tax=Nocardiopsis mangrovi TaxID=1179818 RepID=A0ABV9DWK1_9ACTN
MLLTITTTHRPATDLGFLLHKHPDRVQRFDQSYGTAHVFYPEAGDDRCTAALLLEADPRALLRGRAERSAPDFALAQYVNDRPYAASSLFAVALGDVFRSAIRARCDSRPGLAETAIPLRLHVPAVPCRGGPDQVRALFEPLGWQVEADPVPLDPGLPGWGDSRYVRLTLTGHMRLADALGHLYVLLPAMDGAKHYWVSEDEVDKLLRAGAAWLPGHPQRAWITRRYLARRERYVRTAIARLRELDDLTDPADPADPDPSDPDLDPGLVLGPVVGAPATDAVRVSAGSGAAPGDPTAHPADPAERAPSLAELRAGAVLSVLAAENARRVIDLGCGTGKLVARLLDQPGIDHVTGVDVAAATIEHAHRRLHVDRMPERRRARLDLFTGSVVYRDTRFSGYDAAVLMEVVEHIDPSRLPALEQVVFGHAAPGTVVVTTPNAEYNALYEGLADGAFRHPDHRFEWTRAQFRAWAEPVASAHGYRLRILPVGPEDPSAGAPTQMGVFSK